jgi:6-phosphogluconolactonase (cycloisomerase 2 family)
MDQELTMLIGTYTSGTSKGIYSFRFNQETGKATPLSYATVENPSYLTPSADGKFVYAVSEFNDARAAAYAFAFDKSNGTFRLLNSQKTGGEDPCYILTNGNYVITANYSGGSISTFPLAKDGSLLPPTAIIKFEGNGPDKVRQEKAHLHCVRITPDGEYLLADNLGTDQIHKFKINPQANASNKAPLLEVGTPNAYTVAPGSGPRHLTFAPDGHHAYLINELSGAVIAFKYQKGELEEIQAIAADTVGGKGSADIHISPDGRFLYASNRLKADGIAIFHIAQNGMLTKVGYQLTGIHPRNFIITPNGKLLLVACRDNNVIQIYDRNATTGLLTRRPEEITIDKPVCICFVP